MATNLVNGTSYEFIPTIAPFIIKASMNSSTLDVYGLDQTRDQIIAAATENRPCLIVAKDAHNVRYTLVGQKADVDNYSDGIIFVLILENEKHFYTINSDSTITHHVSYEGIAGTFTAYPTMVTASYIDVVQNGNMVTISGMIVLKDDTIASSSPVDVGVISDVPKPFGNKYGSFPCVSFASISTEYQNHPAWGEVDDTTGVLRIHVGATGDTIIVLNATYLGV